MVKSNVASRKRTAKTSNYFKPSKAKKGKSNLQDLSLTWSQIKALKVRNDDDSKQLQKIASLGCCASTHADRPTILDDVSPESSKNRRLEGVCEENVDDDDIDGVSSRLATCASAEQSDFVREIGSRNFIRDDVSDDIQDEMVTSFDTLKKSPSPNGQLHQQKPKGIRLPQISPYFSKPENQIGTFSTIGKSCLPIPPLSASSFGLIQEQLAHCPFRLLIATIFLNRTRGPVAIPVLFRLFDIYPTVQDMATAQHAEIVQLIHGLGFQNQRATKFIALARKWLESPPVRGRRYRKLNYPRKRDGADLAPGEAIDDELDELGYVYNDETEQKLEQSRQTRVAWEIAHLPGVGAYAIDSWRIFCRDNLRHHSYAQSACTASTTTTTGSTPTEKLKYEPEWKRVLPQDKELRAYLFWKWLREGWVWNCETGRRIKATPEIMERAQRGGILFQGPDGCHLIVPDPKSVEDARNSLDIQKRDGERELSIRKAGFGLECSLDDARF